MGTGKAFDVKSSLFSAIEMDDAAVIYLNNELLLHTTDLSARDQMLNYLDLVSGSDLIKALVIIGSPEKRGCEEYFNFYRSVAISKTGDIPIHRMANVINQLILKLVQLDKIVVHGNSGKIISSFLNISLACDYRIIAENSLFQNPCLDLGLLPKGGGAYFLSKIMGVNRAFEFLLCGENITADQALSLGIVNQVVPVADLETAALKAAKRFSQIPMTTLTGIKRLVNHSYKDLEAYLRFEDHELIHAIKKSEDWKQMEE